MSGLPQFGNLFCLQCGFEVTMFRLEDSCSKQLRDPGGNIYKYIYRNEGNVERMRRLDNES